MVYVPSSRLYFCYVPLSDYSNQIRFGVNDEARWKYFYGCRVATAVDSGNMSWRQEFDETLYPEDDGFFENGGLCFSYIRKTGQIKVEGVTSNTASTQDKNVGKANYIFFKNEYRIKDEKGASSFKQIDDRWIYAFIDNIEWLNPNTCLISYSIDHWQTYESAIKYQESLIERRHVRVADDITGKYVIDEGFNYDYTLNNEKPLVGRYLDNVITILVTNTYKTEPSSTGINLPTHIFFGMSKCVSNLCCYCFNLRNDFSHVFERILANYGANDIISILAVPESVINYWRVANPSGGLSTIQFNTDKPIGYNEEDNVCYLSIYGENQEVQCSWDYTPRNNKLNCYPYKKVNINNFNGSNIDLKPELIDSVDFTLNIRNISNFLGEASAIFSITNYNNGENTYTKMNSFPSLYYDISYIQNYLAYNKASVGMQQWKPLIEFGVGNTQDYLRYIGNNAKVAGTAIAGVLKNDTDGIGLTGSLAGDSIANTTSQLSSGIGRVKDLGMSWLTMQAEMSDRKRQADIPCSDSNNMTSLFSGLLVPVVSCYSYLPQFMALIDNFFDHVGYKIMEFETLNENTTNTWLDSVRHRKYYDFIKTSGCNLTSKNAVLKIPNDSINVIKEMFNNGTTLWHYENAWNNTNKTINVETLNNAFLNYDVNNRESFTVVRV